METVSRFFRGSEQSFFYLDRGEPVNQPGSKVIIAMVE